MLADEDVIKVVLESEWTQCKRRCEVWYEKLPRVGTPVPFYTWSGCSTLTSLFFVFAVVV